MGSEGVLRERPREDTERHRPTCTHVHTPGGKEAREHGRTAGAPRSWDRQARAHSSRPRKGCGPGACGVQALARCGPLFCGPVWGLPVAPGDQGDCVKWQPRDGHLLCVTEPPRCPGGAGWGGRWRLPEASRERGRGAPQRSSSQLRLWNSFFVFRFEIIIQIHRRSHRRKRTGTRPPRSFPSFAQRSRHGSPSEAGNQQTLEGP